MEFIHNWSIECLDGQTALPSEARAIENDWIVPDL